MSRAPSVSRELFLPREVVFDACTQREHLSQWYAPQECSVVEVVVEPAIGGRFEISWKDAAGSLARDSGTFTAITPPEGFVCAMAGRESGAQLHLQLSDRVDTCGIVVSWETKPKQPADDAGGSSQDAFRRQWEDRLQRLEEYFSAI